MKKWVVWLVLALVLAAVNGMVVSKEMILRHGQSMLLKLQPVDPRSLIQGDYMALRYSILNSVTLDETERQGCLVVRLDENNVAQFVRVHKGEALASGEHLLYYHKRGHLKLGAESFLFQETKASEYRRARYAEFKVASDGKSVLAGLRGENFEELGVDKK
jgi:uncharacterized membrane-anchored protein